MRVPPEVISGSVRWQFPLTTLLLSLTVVVGGLVSGFDPTALAIQSNKVSKLQVIVANRNLEVGEMIEKQDLSLTLLPVERVPAETFTSTEEVVGNKVGTHVPPGMPIGAWLLDNSASEDVGARDSEQTN